MNKSEYDKIVKGDMMSGDRVTNDGGYGGFALTPRSVDEEESYQNESDEEESIDEYVAGWTKHGSSGDLTTERKKSYMDNSKAVHVKDKCKLGGEGTTSAACNQGDISNIEMSDIEEDLEYKHVDDATKDKYYLGEDDSGETIYSGCLMVKLKLPKWNIITNKIKEEDIYDVEGYGIEDEPHVTILYGFNNKIPRQEILDNVNKIIDPQEIDLNLTGIDCFENEEYDVVKINVESDKLNYLNKFFTSNYDYQNRFPDYHPHITIAYVKPGCGKKYNKEFGESFNINGSEYKYSISEDDYNDTNETHDVLNNYKDWADNNYKQKISYNKDNLPIEDYDKSYKDLPNNIYTYVNENEDQILNEEFMKLNELPFIDDIKDLGGNIYSVGGIVRDELLGKDSKDLDILITGIPMDKIEEVLKKYGNVDSVGKSFGILKFNPEGVDLDEPIDVAIPRTEKSTGEGGHKGFDVKSDYNLSIEDDLYRRDFTINALAKDLEGNIIDPFGGLDDIKNNRISMVNPEAFSDDPLRMLRAIQFSARFNFDIDDETMKLIKDNAHKIKEIPNERILTEFEKIVKKGNSFKGAKLLKESGLLKEIVGKDDTILVTNKWNDVENVGEFVYLLIQNLVDNPAEFFKKELSGDIENEKIIKALDYAYNNYSDNDVENRVLIFNLNKIKPEVLDSKILPDTIYDNIEEFKRGEYPLTNKDLEIDGNDLKEYGFQGKEIGDMLRKILINIYGDKLKNNKDEIVEFIEEQKNKEE
ncbi:MAG: 2'-5' RNA ligase family protein [bacterium]